MLKIITSQGKERNRTWPEDIVVAHNAAAHGSEIVQMKSHQQCLYDVTMAWVNWSLHIGENKDKKVKAFGQEFGDSWSKIRKAGKLEVAKQNMCVALAESADTMAWPARSRASVACCLAAAGRATSMAFSQASSLACPAACSFSKRR